VRFELAKVTVSSPDHNLGRIVLNY